MKAFVKRKHERFLFHFLLVKFSFISGLRTPYEFVFAKIFFYIVHANIMKIQILVNVFWPRLLLALDKSALIDGIKTNISI